MAVDPGLSTALSELAAARNRYWGRWQTDPWARDEDIEHDLAAAWSAVTELTGGTELVVRLDGAPPCDVGAPNPMVVAGNPLTALVYDDVDRVRRLLTFHHVDSVLFGGINAEALRGHRLWGQGLQAYEFQEVINSAWIAQREQENSVHPSHRGGWHARLRHFVFTFHDDTFECIAGRFVVDDRAGASPTVIAALTK